MWSGGLGSIRSWVWPILLAGVALGFDAGNRTGLVVTGYRYRQPVHHRIGQPDRGARGGRHGQAQAQARCDLPRSG